VNQAARIADRDNGGLIYRTTCVTCHGENGQGGTHGGSALTSDLTLGAIISTVINGRSEMPAFGAAMSQNDAQDLASYLVEELLVPE
jgi:mono/diheme cytochrome c family protein